MTNRGPLSAWYLGPTWVLYGRTHMCLLSGPHMGSVWVFPYGLDRMGPIWACLYGQTRIHAILGLNRLTIWAHMFPLRACSYGQLVYIPHLARMGLLSGPHMGPLLACLYALVRIEPIWALYERAHMGMAVSDQHTRGPYWLAIWAPHGSIIGSSYGLGRMRPI